MTQAILAVATSVWRHLGRHGAPATPPPIRAVSMSPAAAIDVYGQAAAARRRGVRYTWAHLDEERSA